LQAALELVALAAWCFVLALVGGLAGLVLGNLRLPLVLALSSSPAAGAGANIGISGVAAASASVAHVRAGRVDWRLVAWMAPASAVGAVVGGLVSGALPDRALLALIAIVLLGSGLDLLLRRPPPPHVRRRGSLAATTLAGGLIGLLGGTVGLILGTLRVPALIRLAGQPAARAVGTNAPLGVIVGAAGVVGHLPGGAPDWSVFAVGAAASVPGALVGSRFTGRLDERRLLRVIGWIVIVAAIAVAAQAVTA